MKQFKLFAVALAALTMFSCQKQEEPGASDVEAGIPTRAVITLTQDTDPKGLTRAAVATPTDAEKKIESAAVFVFDKATGVLEGQATYTAGQETTGKVINAKTGAKLIYALANIPAAMFTVIDGSSIGAFERKLLNLSGSPIVSTVDPTVIATVDNKFWMTNLSGPTEKLLVLDEAQNKIVVSVGRIVSKVMVKPTTPSMNTTTGTLTNMSFKMAYLARQNYLMPASEGNLRITPYFEETTTTLNPANYFVPPVGDNTFQEANGTLFAYASENAHRTPLEGNSTTILIKGLFTPKQFIDPATGLVDTKYTGSAFHLIKTSGASDGVVLNTCYTRAPTQPEINKILGTTTGITLPYANGLVYYRLIVNGSTGAKNATIRNMYYDVTITSVNGPGSNTESGALPGNPGQEVSQDTKITATISVANWTPITQSGAI